MWRAIRSRPRWPHDRPGARRGVPGRRDRRAARSRGPSRFAAELGIEPSFPERNGAQRQRRMIETGATREEVFAASVRETLQTYSAGGDRLMAEPNAPGSAATTETQPGSGAGEQPSEQEMRAAYEAELNRITSSEMILQTTVSLLNIGGRRLGLTAPGAAPRRVRARPGAGARRDRRRRALYADPGAAHAERARSPARRDRPATDGLRPRGPGTAAAPAAPAAAPAPAASVARSLHLRKRSHRALRRGVREESWPRPGERRLWVPGR